MSLSKSEFYKKLSHCKCNDIFHPWNDNCVLSNVDMLYSSILGINKFYNLYYLVDLFMKRKQLSKDYLKYSAKGLIQSTIFGVFMSNAFLISNCLFTKIFGKMCYYSILFSATIGGLGIFFENPKRRGIAIATFINLALEVSLNKLRDSKILTMNDSNEVLLFMTISAVFMYCLRADQTIKKDNGPYVWFYTPPKFPYERNESISSTNKSKTEICPHEGDCWKDILNTGLRYFSVGSCFQIVRVLAKHRSKILKSPFLVLKHIFNIQNINFGLFLASYLVTYKTVSCMLCHYQGFDSPLYALPAGFLAGSAYLLQPNISILLTVISNLLMIGGRHFRNWQQLPNWPYGELALALSNGILYHCRVNHPQYCPAFLINMMSACTSGKSDIIYREFQKFLQV